MPTTPVAMRPIIDALANLRSTQNVKDSPDVDMNGFGAELKNFLGDAVSSLRKAESTTAAGVAGKASIQDVSLSLNRADVMLQTVVVLRDRMISAFQEIFRMPI